MSDEPDAFQRFFHGMAQGAVASADDARVTIVHPAPAHAGVVLPKEGWGHRVWRPILMCLGVVLVITLLLVLGLVTVMLLRGLDRWSHGQPVDLGGLAGVITAMSAAAGAIIGIINPIFIARHRERYAQIQQGQSVGPFGVSSDSISDGPRPGDSP